MNETRRSPHRRTRCAAIALVLAISSVAAADERRAVDGLVLRVDRPAGRVTISCSEIVGVREATVTEFAVATPTQLEELRPGSMVEFTLVSDDPARIDDVRVRRFEPTDAQGLKVETLRLVERIAASAPGARLVGVGERVPDFTLLSQEREPVRLSELAGRTVALTFVYTSCHLPDYCYRLTNHFGLVQKRFAERLGHDLVLLTVTFDPVHDQPEVMARYGATWRADAKGWHLLGGEAEEVRRVCGFFGMNAWPEMGMLAHELRTAVIDGEGRLVANVEGNEFTARQLGDLIASVLDRSP